MDSFEDRLVARRSPEQVARLLVRAIDKLELEDLIPAIAGRAKDAAQAIVEDYALRSATGVEPPDGKAARRVLRHHLRAVREACAVLSLHAGPIRTQFQWLLVSDMAPSGDGP